MPYIERPLRATLGMPQNGGELNYVITKQCVDYLGSKPGGKPNYATFNEVIGALECAKLELYRRMIAPYEDEKCKANGDVY